MTLVGSHPPEDLGFRYPTAAIPGSWREVPPEAVMVVDADNDPEHDLNVWAWVTDTEHPDDMGLCIQQGGDLLMFNANEFVDVARRIQQAITDAAKREEAVSVE